METEAFGNTLALKTQAGVPALGPGSRLDPPGPDAVTPPRSEAETSRSFLCARADPATAERARRHVTRPTGVDL